MKQSLQRGAATSIALVALLVALGSPAQARAASKALPASSKILVLCADGDERLGTLEQAVEYWKQVFVELGLPVVLESVVVDGGAPRRGLETYARVLSQQAGRNGSGKGPPPPDELAQRSEEVVVLLSRQGIMPFAWPLSEAGPRIFVALPLDLELDVAKHELGHALGLTHSGRSGLMCMPCNPEGTRELKETEQRELLRLYSP